MQHSGLTGFEPGNPYIMRVRVDFSVRMGDFATQNSMKNGDRKGKTGNLCRLGAANLMIKEQVFVCGG